MESGVHADQQDHSHVSNHSDAINQQKEHKEPQLHVPSARKSYEYKVSKHSAVLSSHHSGLEALVVKGEMKVGFNMVLLS